MISHQSPVSCPWCSSPDSRVETREETYEVRGEPVSVEAEVRVCNQCGKTILDLELDDRTLAKAYEIYRLKHGLIDPKKLRWFRAEELGISQRALARLLGFGEISITRYEKGSLPDENHNLNLTLLLEERTFLPMVFQRRGHLLSQKDRDRITVLMESHSPQPSPG